MVKIHISADGSARAIYNEALAAYAKKLGYTKSRASYVEPVNSCLRWCFHRLRKRFGDDGRVARWTRGWSCCWRVNMEILGGTIYLGNDFGVPFVSRQEAIDFEVVILEGLIRSKEAMLVLSRKVGERILIGDDVVVTLVRVTGDKVRLGFDAPKEVAIVREELKKSKTKMPVVPGKE